MTQYTKQPVAFSVRTSVLGAASLMGVAMGLMPAPAEAQAPVVAPFAITPAGTVSVSSAVPQSDPFQIEVRADSLHVDPVMAIGMIDSERTAVRGDDVHFLSYTNYPAFIAHSEVRVFAGDKSADAAPLAVLPVDANSLATWKAPKDGPESLFFVMRVYDASGRFDESRAHELALLKKPLDTKPDVSRPLFGTVDEAEKRNLDLHGITVTVTGMADPKADVVHVSGQIVPVDKTGRFVAQQIVARGTNKVGISITRDGALITEAQRSISQKPHDWFVIGQGEITIGTSSTSGPAAAVSGNTNAQGDYASGRGAFYAKGIVGDDYKVTTSLDTGEARLGDLFRNLDRKNPMALLGRLNNDQYYPTYGDASTITEDAPTQGRYYLRVQKDASQLVVGNFVTAIRGTDLAQLDRGLFGGLYDYNSTGVTKFGERKSQITAFASDPGTIAGRDELRGTGGSLYYLSRQDISVGSERVSVEVRDPTTGIILQSTPLNAQQDYVIDPFQGRVTLLRPLGSYASVNDTVRNGTSAGNIPVLVVNYEYTPAVGNISGYTIGGRATQWLGENIRIGGTAQRDESGRSDQKLIGGDVLLRYAAGTYLKGEIAQTKGPGIGQSNSIDGGLNYRNIASPAAIGMTADAWRVEGAIDVAELAHATGNRGKASGYYQHTQAGFSSLGQLTLNDQTRWGAAASFPLTSKTQVAAKIDQLQDAATGTNRTATLDIEQKLTPALSAKIGVRNEVLAAGLLNNSVQTGERTDAALQLTYAPKNANYSVYGFGQTTLDHDASRNTNDRVGVGAKAELTDRLSANAEVSEGDGGIGANAQLNEKLGKGSEAYIGYVLAAEQSNAGLEPQNLFTSNGGGMLTMGARQRFSDSFSVNGEQRLGMGGSAPSLDRTYGFKYEPSKHISVTGSFETGQIDNALTGQTKRTAGTIGFGYSVDHFKISSSVEGRFDRGQSGTEDAWLFKNNIDYGINPDWRFLGHLNIAFANGTSGSIGQANFVEAVGGFAYRPIENTRLNILARGTYLEDLGPIGQITAGGTTQSPKQISSIVSIDANYELTSRLTIGAKFGLREGSVSLSRDSSTFVKSTAQLGVIRADYRVVRAWDVLLEGRVLNVSAANDTHYGVLGAVYRHLNEHVKIGAGYSLSAFSDDLSDQSYTSHGPFVNIIGKF